MGLEKNDQNLSTFWASASLIKYNAYLLIISGVL